MTGPPSLPSRRFNEQEVAEIIKRASELQQTEAPADTSSGMSLAELEQVAREAGLDPTLVRRAAADLDLRVSDQTPSRFLGAPTVLCLERTMDGEVPEEEYEPIVLEIQRVLGQVGTASTLGRSLQWSAQGMGARARASSRNVQVTLMPRNGRTTIRVEEQLGGLAGHVFGGLMGGIGGGFTGVAAGIGLGVLHSGLAAGGIWVSFLGGSYLLARTIFGRIVRGRGDRFQELMDRLSEHVAASVSARTAPDAPTR